MKRSTKSGRLLVVGVMGGAVVSPDVEKLAEELGAALARAGYVVLTGGRPVGVMAAASRAAHRAGGLVVGVLPGADAEGCAPGVDIAIATSLGDGRNLLNVLSSDVLIALPGGAGTLSEIALAVKNQRPLVLLATDPGPVVEEAIRQGRAARARNVQEALNRVERFLELAS
jgi:uncharacterized protein (TIGR00725 family)